LGLGIGYQKIRKFAFAFDVNIYPAYKYYELESDNASVARENRANTVINYSTGFESYVFQRWILRGGLFTNMSGAKALNSNITTYQPSKISFYGASFTISHESDRTTVSAGGYYQGGKGYGSLLNSDGLFYVYPRSEHHYTFILSSTYFF